MQELVKYHISGQLRVAPEHVSDQVLHYMGKPSHQIYQTFLREYDKANEATGKKQYAVPYFMSSHPGCTIKDAVKLAEYVRDLGFTPGTGAGLLSNTIHTFYLYVLYRYQSTGRKSVMYRRSS